MDLDRLAELALKLSDDATVLRSSCIPFGADEDEAIPIAWRRMKREEFAAWIDRPASDADTLNTAKALALAIGDVDRGTNERALIERVEWLCDISDQPIIYMVESAVEHLGYAPVRIESITVGKRTTEADLGALGLPPSVLELRVRYSDPGALRACRCPIAGSFVVRRPGHREYADYNKARRSIGLSDMLRACLVYPSSAEARSELVTRFPALGASMSVIFAAMRAGGERIDQKKEPSGGAARGQ